MAINAAQYGGSQSCGLCVAYRGTGTGTGGTPIPTSYQYAQGEPPCTSHSAAWGLACRSWACTPA